MGKMTGKIMRKIVFIIWLVAIAGLIPKVGICQSSASIGGYDVAKIVSSTLNVLKEKNVISEFEQKEFAPSIVKQSADPLTFGPEFVDFYSDLGALLVEKKIVTQKEIDTAKASAAQTGGVKIGGLNPVVLAASYLNILVQKGIVTLPTAQSILDTSKTNR